jgi:hypothetical protein
MEIRLLICPAQQATATTPDFSHQVAKFLQVVNARRRRVLGAAYLDPR